MGIFDFSAIKSSLQSVDAKVKGLKREILVLRSRRHQLGFAMPTKSEMQQLIIKWTEAKRKEAGFEDFLGELLEIYQQNSGTISDPSRLANPLHRFGGEGGGSRAELNLPMFAIFSEQISAALIKALDNIDWPTGGLSYAERSIESEKLRVRIEALDLELSGLVKEAKDAGIEIK
ncbi:MAG: hypothetical protein Q8R06_09685 [Polaromonas sp.]|uniref:hypothetical protein n=1 Tax=Polaromonas sp. TaxID=1869339 RepID=UPI00273262B8|nr:hypothetical protein [Polaromonas sp.]MDP3797406.1 hypothetical protein [Polaromonas sp.]